MKNMKGSILVLFVITTLTAVAQKTYKSQLTHANVYYGYGAELNHSTKASLDKGTQEITIENISNVLDPNTVQISVPENVVLLSYRFNAKTIVLNHLANPSIKRMEDSLKLVQKLITNATNEANVTSELLDKTSRLIETYSSGATKNLSTADLIKLLDFYTTKVQSYRTTVNNLQIKKQELTEVINEINIRLEGAKEENDGNASKVVGEMILQLMAQQPTTAELGISYFTQSAGWIPTYDMRVKSIDNSFKLSYKASVNQNTGLDWKQVKLTLSTSNPNQGNIYPTLNPLFLQLYNPQVYAQMKQNNTAANYNRAQSMREVVVSDLEGRVPGLQVKEEEDKSDVSNYLTLNESQLNTSFEIDLPYDIPSDGKSYSVAIKDETLKATYKHYAIPKLDRDAFLLAEISDWENLDLLPGAANIIMDNVYLGKSFIDPNTTTDTLNLSLGRDKRVAVKRLLVKEFSKSKIKGDNKTETFTYEITVRNNKSKEMSMLLKDQFPISQMNDVIVKLENDGGAEINAEIGTLNWKVNLKPGDSKKFRFSYSVTYPKDKKIANLR
jgi:uncharacterized protein (TIGR02231 family)